MLEALGARIDLDPPGVAACIEEAGFGFMFAPAHHQATRYVVPVRSELAVRTIFNLLGPLTNPAGARRQVIGVADPSFAETMAGALAALGADRALVVCSEDGLDELSICAPTHVLEVDGEQLRSYTLTPGEVGIEPVSEDAFQQGCAGGTPQDNAAVTRALLAGGRPIGRRRAHGGRGRARVELAAINGGAAIYAGGRADTIAAGVQAARAALQNGSAAAALERYVQASHAHAPAEASR